MIFAATFVLTYPDSFAHFKFILAFIE